MGSGGGIHIAFYDNVSELDHCVEGGEPFSKYNKYDCSESDRGKQA
jgi:hypothetical protein